MDENAPDYVHDMFASLVPGFSGHTVMLAQSSSSVFHDGVHSQVAPVEALPVLPPSAGERVPEQTAKLFMDTLLEQMVHTVVRLEWHDKLIQQHRCFNFLLEKFKTYYLPNICPNFCHDTSLYAPYLGKWLKQNESRCCMLFYQVCPTCGSQKTTTKWWCVECR